MKKQKSWEHAAEEFFPGLYLWSGAFISEQRDASKLHGKRELLSPQSRRYRQLANALHKVSDLKDMAIVYTDQSKTAHIQIDTITRETERDITTR